jgi:tetratricopeptide (TPR) repeat protein
MPEPPTYRFGQREARPLTGIPLDVSFLSWNRGYNASVVLCAQAEEVLLCDDEDSPSDALDRAMLAMSLSSQWSPKDDESGTLAYVAALRNIQHDAAQRAAWQDAGNRLGQGAQLHRSEPVRALELYREALELFEGLGDEKGAGRCRGNIGLLMLDHQHVEEGVGECMKALELHARVNYDRGWLMHLGNVIGAAFRHERWEDALSLGRQRIPVTARSQPAELAAAYGENGWLALQLGQRADAEQSYRDAIAALDFVQTPAGFKRQIDKVGALAHALGHAQELQDNIPRLQQETTSRLQSLDVAHLVPSGRIIDDFREALKADDHTAIYRALAQSECWSSLAFESALAQQAIYTLLGEQQTASEWMALARRFALTYCRSFLDRGPLDEYSLYTTWSEDKRLMKARAYSLKLAGLKQATMDDREGAAASLQASFNLHALIGDRDASGRWFPEAFSEIAVSVKSRTAMHRLMFRAYQEDAVGRRDDAQRSLSELLDLASREGTTMDVVDAWTRLGIHYAGAQRPPDAMEWFARAEQGFRSLETIGVSVREFTGRAHNKLKMCVHLVETLERAGRFSEAAFVGVASLRECDWFIASFQHPEYVPRAMDYKSRMLHTLARAYERMGGFEKALAYADELLAWAERVGDASARGAAHHSRALALRALLRPADASAAAQADLDAQRQIGDPKEVAVALVLCAELAMDEGDMTRARELADEAVAMAANPRAGSSARDGKYVLARIAEHEGMPEEATRLYTEILADEEALPGPNWIATATVLANRLLEAGRAADATAMAQRAWHASAEVHSLPLRVNAGCALVACQLETGGVDAIRTAIDVLVDCCRMVEAIRGEMADEAHKTSAASAWLRPFEVLLATYLAIVEIDPNPEWKRLAFTIAERAKARALAESIAASSARAAEAQGFRLTGLTVRPEDPHEAIVRTDFSSLRDLLRNEAAMS